MIRQAQKEDKDTIKAIWDDRLGPFDVAWRRYWRNDQPNEFWVMTDDGRGSCHYLVRKSDGYATIYEIVVAADARRQGIGSMLLEHVGTPVRLKTDQDNVESNAFYHALGFRLEGRTASKKGKPMNNYVLE